MTAQRGLGYLVLPAGNIDEAAPMLAAIVLLLGVGRVLCGAVPVVEAGFARWYGAPMVAEGFG